MKEKILRIAIMVVLSLMAAISLRRGCENALIYSQDFQWDAARAFMLKIDPYDESLSPTGALNTGNLVDFYGYFESIDAPQKMEANQFPSLLMLLIPYACMMPDTARLVWLISNLLFTVGITILLRATFLKNVPVYEYAALILLMIGGTPFRNQLGVGQHTLFSLFFFLLAVWFMEKKISVASSAALAVSYFKYTLTAPLALYFIYKRKWKEFICSVAIHIALTEVAAIWLNESFLDMLVKPLKVSGALASEGGLDIGALLNGSGMAFVLAGLIMAMLLLLALKLPTDRDGLLISVLVLWSLIITYHRTYDFFVIIIAAAILETSSFKEQSPSGKIRLAGFLIVLFMTFFVLRVFDESLSSRIVTGIMYYAYTIYVTVFAYKNINMRKNKVRN